MRFAWVGWPFGAPRGRTSGDSQKLREKGALDLGSGLSESRVREGGGLPVFPSVPARVNLCTDSSHDAKLLRHTVDTPRSISRECSLECGRFQGSLQSAWSAMCKSQASRFLRPKRLDQVKAAIASTLRETVHIGRPSFSCGRCTPLN